MSWRLLVRRDVCAWVLTCVVTLSSVHSLCDADANSSSVVGVSHTGCLCVWELSLRGSSRMVWAPENEGWQLARWGAGDTLMTGLHNGDIILHFHKSGLIHGKDQRDDCSQTV